MTRTAISPRLATSSFTAAASTARAGTGAGRTRPRPRPRGRWSARCRRARTMISLKSFIASIRHSVSPRPRRAAPPRTKAGWSGAGPAVEGAHHRAGDAHEPVVARPSPARRRGPARADRLGRPRRDGPAHRDAGPGDLDAHLGLVRRLDHVHQRVEQVAVDRRLAGPARGLGAQRAPPRHHLLGGLGEHRPQHQVLLGEPLRRLLGHRRQVAHAAARRGPPRAAASSTSSATGPRRRPARPSATWRQLRLHLGPAAAVDDVAGGLGQDRRAQRVRERGARRRRAPRPPTRWRPRPGCATGPAGRGAR